MTLQIGNDTLNLKLYNNPFCIDSKKETTVNKENFLEEIQFIVKVDKVSEGLREDNITKSGLFAINGEVTEVKTNISNPKAFNRAIHELINSLVNYTRIDLVNEEKQQELIQQETDLKQVVANTKEEVKSDFTDFLKGIDDALKNYNEQLVTMNTKLNFVSAIIDMYEISKPSEMTGNSLLD